MAARIPGQRDGRRVWRACVTLVAACAAATAGLAVAAPAGAATPSSSPAPSTGGTAYRHGVVPAVGATAGTSSTVPHALNAHATSSSTLSYGGGVGGVGVLTGTPQVYLVFYGFQWGTPGTTTLGGHAYKSFSGDARGVAPVEQAFFAGLGTGGETWSGVMTQYCQGIAAAVTTCTPGAAHVGSSNHGVLAGVWEDTGSASPASATAAQLATEAEAAAAHFGNTTQASNRSTQYVIVSPTGTHPDGFGTASGNFCAWHDYTGDPSIGTVAQPAGMLAFTNMPYLPDLGTSCGQNFVNPGAAGLLDGVTIVGGHEYAETLTDQFPAGGWTSSQGEEAGDLCAWLTTGSGASADVSTSTGIFAVQSIWANDGNGGAGACETSHPVVTASNTVAVVNPGTQTVARNAQVSLQVRATDSAPGVALAYAATGLPAGYAINPSTGRITGKSMRVVTSSATVRVSDPSGVSGSATFTWTT
jgi:serine protease